jgi:DNA-binding NtrC family response regulator
MASDAARSNTQTLSERIESSRAQPTEPFLFVLFDADRPLGPMSRHALGDVDEVHLRRGVERGAFRKEEGGRRLLVLTFTDPRMSGVHAYVRRRGSTFVVEDARSKNGTLLDGRRVSKGELSGEHLLELGHTFILFDAIAPVPPTAERDFSIDQPAISGSCSTLCTALERTFRQVVDVAPSTLPILVQGETGTGKEVVARAIHRFSGRTGAFVAVNCGGIPSSLVEAELFGFKKGSFSGASDDRMGLARAAHGGTLFLDEIADLPLPAQGALLRVLQERKVVPIGGVTPLDADFRLLSATHMDLEGLVARGLFREDLLARLDAFVVKLPPLRSRRKDLGLLVARILAEHEGHEPLPFTLDAVRSLLGHSWPRNVRELGHRVRLSLVLARDTGRIEREHLFARGTDLEPRRVTDPASAARAVRNASVAAPDLAPEDVVRRDEIIALLRRHGGNVTAVAHAMGKARAQVQRWMRRYGVDRRAVVAG